MTLLLNADLSTGDRSQLGDVEYGGTFDGTPPLSERVLVAPEIDGYLPAQGRYLMRIRCAPDDVYGNPPGSGWRTLFRLEEPIRGRKAGEVSAITYAILVPKGWPGDARIWVGGLEWHNSGGAGTPAPHHLYVYGDRMHADLWWGRPGSPSRLDADFERGYAQGEWYAITELFRHDRAPNAVCQVYVGRKGADRTMRKAVDWSGVGSMYDDTDSNYGLFGVYRDQSGQSVSDLYFGGLREYSTLDEALGWAEDEILPAAVPPPDGGLPLTRLAGGNPGDATVTLGWTPVPGAEGYLLLRDGVRVSRTFDPARDRARFAYDPASRYEVVAVDFRELARGAWPA